VVKVLLRVVEGFTVDEAVVVMQEAHLSGVALVRMCAQDEAERYCEDMRLNGLISTIEPAGPAST
jgi:ATP-dependent Clp protease adaptor protein ClpS